MTTLIKHYLMRAAWAVLPTAAKVAIWKHHRASLKPTRFCRKGN